MKGHRLQSMVTVSAIDLSVCSVRMCPGPPLPLVLLVGQLLMGTKHSTQYTPTNATHGIETGTDLRERQAPVDALVATLVSISEPVKGILEQFVEGVC